MLINDFNVEPNEPAVSDFCEIYNTENIIKKKTCFENPETLTYIKLILTNRPKNFQNSIVTEMGLFDFLKMCEIVMRMYYS